MNIVRHVSTNNEYLLWSRCKAGQPSHVLYDMDGQIVCDFGSELPSAFLLRETVKALRATKTKSILRSWFKEAK